MPYRAGSTMTLGTRTFKRGEVIPESVLREIPYGRFGSLTRTGLLKEDLSAKPVVEADPETAEAETMCPVCGEGPFTRLARHMTKHEDDSVLDEETT